LFYFVVLCAQANQVQGLAHCFRFFCGDSECGVSLTPRLAGGGRFREAWARGQISNSIFGAALPWTTPLAHFRRHGTSGTDTSRACGTFGFRDEAEPLIRAALFPPFYGSPPQAPTEYQQPELEKKNVGSPIKNHQTGSGLLANPTFGTKTTVRCDCDNGPSKSVPIRLASGRPLLRDWKSSETRNYFYVQTI